MSSGEAELAGIVKGSAEALGLRSLGSDLGVQLNIEIFADSSAAIGICRRTGIGKVRHLATGQLWVQERLRVGDMRLFKVLGTENPADMLTKPVPRDDMNRYFEIVSLGFSRGRAETAPHVAK